MTKYKTTDREQRNNNYLVVGFGYCTIQNITRFLDANAYTCGVYGWRADFYEFGNVTISTGYAPLTFAYDKQARRIGAYIYKKLLQLEKNINRGKFKTNTGDWHKISAKVKKRIEAIIKDAYEKTAEQ